MCWCGWNSREHYTEDTRLCPLSSQWTFPGSCALHSSCAITPIYQEAKQPQPSVTGMFRQSWPWGTAGSTEVSESKKGSNICLHACVFYCILNLFGKKKKYDDCLAVFPHVCSSRLYTIKGLCCQSWKLFFFCLFSIHPSLPWKLHLGFPLGTHPTPQPSHSSWSVHGIDPTHTHCSGQGWILIQARTMHTFYLPGHGDQFRDQQETQARQKSLNSGNFY